MIVSRVTIDGIVFEIEDISHYRDGVNAARILSSSNGKASAIWLDGGAIIQPYLSDVQQVILSWANGRTPLRALVLGNGCCAIARFLFQAFSGIYVTGVEKSPEITQIAKQYFCFGLPLRQMSIVEADAFEFVSCSNLSKYDIVVIDLFNGHSFLEKQVSMPFLAHLERLLACDSIAAFNLSTATSFARQKLVDNLTSYPFLLLKTSGNNLFVFKEVL